MKSKPLPPLKSLKEREREEEEEEMEMKELVASTEEDKDDYYFEDPSNISEFIVYIGILYSQYVLSSDSSR